MNLIGLRSPATWAAIAVLNLTFAGHAGAAPLVVVTPGEQNTASGENGCTATPCMGGHWLHYPELLQVALGAGYAVQNDGDGGAVLGCDAATTAYAGGNSFCKSAEYTKSVATPPDVVIIGPFGEHDQRIVGSTQANVTALYLQSIFEGAYEGLVQKYLPSTTKIYMMTPIDIPWGGTPALPAGDDLVKNIMLPAAIKIAQNHGLTIIDTYTAISGTPSLVTMYNSADGQVNSAGQQKMAELIEAALAGGTGGGGAGGTSAGGAGAGGATSTAGSGGTTSAGGGATSAGGAPGGASGHGGAATSSPGGGANSSGAPNESSGGAAGMGPLQSEGGANASAGAAAACIGVTCLCSDDLSMSTPEGSDPIACAPYTCNRTSGICRVDCTSIDDCSAGNVCGSNRACHPSGSASGTSGGCNITAQRSSGLGALAALFALALSVGRRKRRGAARR